MSVKRRCRQMEMRFPSWGGPRKGAGRPRAPGRPRMSHLARARLAARYPVHVTLRLRSGLPSLRNIKTETLLRQAFVKAKDRLGCRLIEYSIQRDHLHLIVEAKGTQALSRGMQGLQIRIAKALNRLWQRTGQVFGDRYHAHILRTPREVRNALAYVLHNARKHGHELRQHLDRFSSGAWFRGWKENVVVRGIANLLRPVSDARTWLLAKGWRRHGLIRVAETPGSR